jgi:hypothetical protein
LAQFFFDTSAAVKYYHTETGSPKVLSIFAEPHRRVRISSLGLLELHSAFAMKVDPACWIEGALGCNGLDCCWTSPLAI